MLGKSPAQLLNSRQLKSNLPATSEMLKPQPVPNMSKCIKKRQAEQKFQHDRKLSPKTGNCEPKVGQAVRFKDPKGDWQYGRVTRKHHTPRSFIVENRSGKEYRRNKRHMFKNQRKASQQTNHRFWWIRCVLWKTCTNQTCNSKPQCQVWNRIC